MSFDQLRHLIPGLWDLVEILIVAYVIYRLLVFLAGTRALQILIGLVILGAIYSGAILLRFNMITTLFGFVFAYGAFAAVVVFQPELRQAFARLGRVRFLRALAPTSGREVADEIADAIDRLARSGTGAIIALEGEVSLNHFLETGTEMQAAVSANLLTTIFTPYSPLHDGAVIIQGSQIVAAGVVLPLTQFPVSDKTLGTRHRAALGLSEESDAMVIVVSEESSTITLAQHGVLKRGITADQVRETLARRNAGGLALTAKTNKASPA